VIIWGRMRDRESECNVSKKKGVGWNVNRNENMLLMMKIMMEIEETVENENYQNVPAVPCNIFCTYVQDI